MKKNASKRIEGTSPGRLRPLLRIAALGCAATALAAEAHVKWFAPYIVGAPPQPLSATLTNQWFWIGIALVLVFFLATRAIEKMSIGQSILAGMDKVMNPLWLRLDDFVRVVIAAFFVAIFAVGGVYLTPDLKTPNEWVSWMQLLIAAFVFSRRTMPLAAAGIILLWVLALTEYDLFHLLDYLALGVSVAGYLVLESSNKPEWRKYRFEVLRWGVAIALMWSSLEKFAYPDWFYPLVEEKPFLTFGMPRDVFIPMAGVAEFTMGFGLLWTALVRRLSAITLFVIFNAAVYPFGRIDLVGHALIMAIIVAIAADPTPQVRFAIRRSAWTIPAALSAALVVFASGYWGLHLALYGPNGEANPTTAEMATHTYSAEHPHGPQAIGKATAPPAPAGAHGLGHAAPPASASGGSARGAYEASMAKMHGPMQVGIQHPDPDVAFVLGMIPHHQGAIDMAQIQLQYGKDPANRKLAREIIAAQQHEIEEMKSWLAARGVKHSE
ncbi:MAG: DUF305 domain-containing protein [Ramlibacter sp.]|jgi:hypothetical protein|uniref:DUF305 domain-containing protein n=2 Tax=Caenimonas TaxID=763439 RepID=A0A844B7Z2_9BURK|nr:DUF305 domain-containing protein [Caenimonas koreensis]MCA0213152.1 DUF305 domain-containing protein [Pseudomonadota bacterium]MCW5648229.1 DUF305 domain-containing protein [Ramlibacter sp.]MRD47749.1 DUF305 domain-containing protein [Caenimonas koreensis DSM 17982]